MGRKEREFDVEELAKEYMKHYSCRRLGREYGACPRKIRNELAKVIPKEVLEHRNKDK